MKENLNLLCENIRYKIDLRQSLIEIKKQIKDKDFKKKLAYYLEGNYEIFLNCLGNDDPKVRKNAVLILGSMEDDSLVDELFSAYKKEETLFNRPAYLASIANYDYDEIINELYEIYSSIDTETVSHENLKHIMEEKTALYEMLLNKNYFKRKFTGGDVVSNIILTGNRDFAELYKNYTDEKILTFGGGVIVKNSTVNSLKDIRIYNELLLLPKYEKIKGNAGEIADKLIESNILSFLDMFHEPKGSYSYRLDIKNSRLKDQDKTKLIKNIASELFLKTKGRLMNTGSSYEVELRLVHVKDGSYIPMIKLYTLEDNRFAYRKEHLSESIKPNKAALIMELIKDELKEDALVLDPFCGAGTMLIERDKLLPSKKLIGIDIYDAAIDFSKENSKKAGSDIEFIKRDFFDFKLRIPNSVDEIITDLPCVSGKKNEDYIKGLYERFIDSLPEMLSSSGKCFVYTRESEIFKEVLKDKNIEIIKEYNITKKKNDSLFIL